MDGVGCGARDDGDAVWLAKTPTLDALASSSLSTRLRAHGLAVGLPSDDDMGNSEVGHNAFGAGRVFDQGAKRVQIAMKSGEVFKGDEWVRLINQVRQSGEAMHFIGLLSDGNVHSHIDHLFAMLRQCDRDGVRKARVHALLDGRDVPETSALQYVEALENVLAELNKRPDRDYRIASGGGRMRVTMDRYNADWDMVRLGWEHHVLGRGQGFKSAREAVEGLREADPGVIDQDLPGFVVVDDGGAPVGRIVDGAAVVFFNFRGDRAIEMTRALTEADLSEFDRGALPDIAFAGMMEYDGDLRLPKHYLVQPPEIDRTLGEYLVHNDVQQFACSETQKFGHVTYFWNGNRGGYIDADKEHYVEIPSDRISFDQRPEMKAKEITDATIAALKGGRFKHGRINFANGDMVGHTGNLKAAVTAVETVDQCLARLLATIKDLNGAMIVTADHGNCDEMFERDRDKGVYKVDEHGHRQSKTSHSLNEVPLYVYAPGIEGLEICRDVKQPGLANVAASALHLMGLQRPEGYAPGLLLDGRLKT